MNDFFYLDVEFIISTETSINQCKTMVSGKMWTSIPHICFQNPHFYTGICLHLGELILGCIV